MNNRNDTGDRRFFEPVLDKGHVQLLNLAGPFRRGWLTFDASDIDPARVARQSFDGREEERPEHTDLRLCEYLMKNLHTTPIEMIEVWCTMKLPIFVARQFVRHRTVTINEVSARYVQLPAEWYIPNAEDVGVRPENIKQGRLLDGTSTDQAVWFLDELNAACARDYRLYEEAIDRGIPPELARMSLHLNHYTEWVWKQNLHNLMHFCSLRDHSHAQREAQLYAQAVVRLLRQHLPRTMELYDKYRRRED